MGIFISKIKPTYPSWKEEIKTIPFRTAVIGEFIATFIFLFSTIGCVVFTQDGGISTARQLQVSLIFGNSITILVFIFAGISGGNINPAVSWALMLTGKISPVRCLCYSIAQVLGAICGTGFVRVMTPALFDQVNGGANAINPNATLTEAMGVEFACTALLVMTVMAACDSVRAESNKHIPTIAPIVIGLAVTGAHFIAIPVDNCSINPARSFGVSAVSGYWNDHHVFWFGPYLGSTFAAILYYHIFEVGNVSAAAATTPAPAAAAITAPKTPTSSASSSSSYGGDGFSSSTPALTLGAKRAASPNAGSSTKQFAASYSEATVDISTLDGSAPPASNDEWK